MAVLPMLRSVNMYPAAMLCPLVNNQGPYWNPPLNPGTFNLPFLQPIGIGRANPAAPVQTPFSMIVRWGKLRGVIAGYARPAVSALAPTVASVAPNNGPAAGGQTRVITGTHFVGTTGITFGGVPVPFFTVLTTNTIQVTVPPHAAGAVDVVVTTATGGAGTGLGVYTYT